MPPLARFVLPFSLTCLLALAWPGSLTRVGAQRPQAPIVPPVISVPSGSASVEQTDLGERPAPSIVESFDGLGVGFEGPHGTRSAATRPTTASPSVPTTSSRPSTRSSAIFTKKGPRFDSTGARALRRRCHTNTVFKGFGGTCEARNNGDAVVRYDQLAHRWLIVMPIFRRGGGEAGSAAGGPTQRRRRTSACRAWPGSPGRQRRSSFRRWRLRPRRRLPRRNRRGRGRARRAAGTGARTRCAMPSAPSDDPARVLLSVRVPAAAVSRLPAPGDLARRLLRADQHRRRPDPTSSRSTRAWSTGRGC